MQAAATLLLSGLLAVEPAVASEESAPATPTAKVGEPEIPVSRTSAAISVPPVPPPKRFETSHSIRIGDARIAYRTVAGETYLYDHSGEPIGSIFSFSYLKDGKPDPRRPIMFVFNGGPGTSTVWLHMGAFGPQRVVLDRESHPSMSRLSARRQSVILLDSTDLVFIDAVGTGSRASWPRQHGYFWGVDQDADSVAQLHRALAG